MWIRPLQGFPEEYHCRLSVAALRHDAFEPFTFVIHGVPEIVLQPLDLPEERVEMPLITLEVSDRLNAAPPDLRSKIVPNRFDQNGAVS